LRHFGTKNCKDAAVDSCGISSTKASEKRMKQDFGYGGDFGDHINDKQFCLNGILSPDRQAHPALHEIKYLQQAVALVHKGKETSVPHVADSTTLHFCFENRFHQTPWTELQLKCFWSTDCLIHTDSPNHAQNMSQAEFDDKGVVTVEINDSYIHLLRNRNRIWINFRWFYRNRMEWMTHDVDTSFAKDQVELCLPVSSTQEDIPQIPADGCLKVQNTKDTVEIWLRRSVDKYFSRSAVINKHTGNLDSFRSKGGEEILSNGMPMKPNFTRAITDNDRGGIDRIKSLMPSWVSCGMSLVGSMLFSYSYWFRWQKHGLDPEFPPEIKCHSLQIVKDTTSSVKLLATCSLISKRRVIFQQNIVYEFHTDGSIKLSTQTIPTADLRKVGSLPRIGYSMCIDEKMNRILYMGRGPIENYADRKEGSDLGVWSASPKEMGYNYIVPSENGNRSDCCWCSLANETGEGIVIVATEVSASFNFSALLHAQDELHRATHTHHLEEREEGPIYLSFDRHQMGIGGDVGWSPCVYKPYLLQPDKEFYSSFWLCPQGSGDDPADLGRRKIRSQT